ncbi:NAD(P)-dependent dehydrogenase (short-subunit alcohol dehydrogenase family) [Ochrobactrum daejeonense]|uniref:NAD(P)-dependent dehydrogenase (Short-subunit alcohol dehydrogenase family) n=1 Tax=Brucella daejeonensis TaxID=659015 RepID=A0A7W9B1F7_9HYPH|nr:SDR family oxidoreductase [Brucella daejeonensis]MBB5704495.1 NAD(P)-dependent dehydrogenase (short-subunit alcohol dehydrogenase family) [Brucella daejeonensis]
MLKDKIVIVTGGARGIGAAICQVVCAQGGTAVIGDLNGAEEAAERLRALGFKAEGITLDVTKSSSVDAVVDRTVAQHGRIDGFVANAAFANSNALLDHSDEEWRRVMSVNLDGVFYSVRAAGGQMVKAGSGAIVAISSIAGVRAVRPELHAAYDVSKAAVAHLARVVGVEWAKAGVRVNAVGPGYTETELLKSVGIANPEILARWLDDIPTGRLLQPEQIANVVAFLLSDASSAINAQLIMADSGYSS